MTIDEFQQLIDRMYSDKDRRRGAPGTFLWLNEEIGELAAAIAEGTREEQAEEFADVLAWLSTLASIAGVDLAQATAKYATGCPKCAQTPCRCPEPEARGE